MGLGRMHIILIVLVVFRAVPRNVLCCQIADPPFQVVGRDLAEWPQCVALESRRSNQTSAGAGPPTRWGGCRTCVCCGTGAAAACALRCCRACVARQPQLLLLVAAAAAVASAAGGRRSRHECKAWAAAARFMGVIMPTCCTRVASPSRRSFTLASSRLHI